MKEFEEIVQIVNLIYARIVYNIVRDMKFKSGGCVIINHTRF